MDYEVLESELLSDNWGVVTRTKLRLTDRDGNSSDQWRETYDRGDGATVLLYDPDRRHVLLGRQFRWPAAYRNDPDPHLVETAAGLLEESDPETRIRAETQEELGLTLGPVRKLFTLYMSPGSVTEQIHFFCATYSADEAQARYGGIAAEGEEVEVLDLPFATALTWVQENRIRDAKTVILLQYAALHLMT